MKRTMKLLLLLGLTICGVGCSKTQTATVAADKWEIGQHRTCFYGHANLFCFTPDEFKGTNKRDGTPYTPQEIFLERRATPYWLARRRDEQTRNTKLKDTAEVGVYETKFASFSTVEFSWWDCYKTGVGSPAIACTLNLKPTKEQTNQYTVVEKEQADLYKRAPAIARYLRELTPEKLVAVCGPVEEVHSVDELLTKAKEKGVSYTPSYGRNINFPNASFEWFDGKISQVSAGYIGWGGWFPRQNSSDDLAADALREFPCLLNAIPN